MKASKFSFEALELTSFIIRVGADQWGVRTKIAKCLWLKLQPLKPQFTLDTAVRSTSQRKQVAPIRRPIYRFAR